MLYGMIDIGSSSIRVAVYRITGDDAVQVMKRKNRTGLASHVIDGVMQESGISLASVILTEYRRLLAGLGVDKSIAFATAALRNAQNSREAVSEIEARSGVKIRILTGEEEACLGFIGALRGSGGSGILIDIGGGSTEILRFENGAQTEKTSLPIGALMMTAHHVESLFPTEKEAEAIRMEAKKAASSLSLSAAGTAIGIGGTFKSAYALYKDFYGEDSDVMDSGRLKGIIGRFVRDGVPDEEDAAKMMEAAPDRIETVIPGLIVALSVMERLGVKEIASRDQGVREGILYEEVLKSR